MKKRAFCHLCAERLLIYSSDKISILKNGATTFLSFPCQHHYIFKLFTFPFQVKYFCVQHINTYCQRLCPIAQTIPAEKTLRAAKCTALKVTNRPSHRIKNGDVGYVAWRWKIVMDGGKIIKAVIVWTYSLWSGFHRTLHRCVYPKL